MTGLRLVSIAVMVAAVGCGVRPSPVAPATGKKLHILASTFPMTLFARNVTAGREGVYVEPMLPASMGCPHDYVLTPEDLRKIAEADVLVVNGLGMEEYLGKPVERVNATIRVLDSSHGVVGLLPSAGDKNHGHEHGVYNPHLFASPSMAAKVVRNLAEELAAVDPAGADLYRRNAHAYAARLEALAGEFAATGFRSRKIVTQHAVFDYLARDAGLEIVAVVEETPGQEPSAARMIEIVSLIRSSGAAAVFTEPQYPAKVTETIAKEAGVPVATLDPVASRQGRDDAPLDYYERTMHRNLQTLQRTLSGP
jgi:ABC-type Zn uptake system ZnuABC Zn-binding protein ZnuA